MCLRDYVVFGERNSGTNFVSHLLDRNFAVFRGRHRKAGVTPYGWKHGFPAAMAAPDDVLAVIVTRDPQTWVQSMHRTPWHAADPLRKMPLSEFIRAEWHAVVDHRGFGVRRRDPVWGQELMWDRNPENGKRFANILRLRNAKARGFLAIAELFSSSLLVRYEDVAEDPEAMLDAVAARFSLERGDVFAPIATERGRAQGAPYAPKTYAELTTDDADFIWSELDGELESRMGYARKSRT